MANTPVPTVTPVIAGVVSGTNIPADSRPINKWDWFKLSRTWVFGSEDRLKSQVDSIQNAIKWFFTLGTSATILGVIFKDPKLGTFSLCIFGIALFLLLIAYGISTLAITLVSRTMSNPDSSVSISDAFNHSNIRSRWMILVSSLSMVTGMALFPVAVVLSFQPAVVKTEQPAKFAASCVTIGTLGSKQITDIDISGFSPDSTKLKFRLSGGGTLLSAALLDTFTHVLNHSRFDLVYHLPKSIKVDKSHFYLTLIYKSSQDSIASQSVILKP